MPGSERGGQQRVLRAVGREVEAVGGLARRRLAALGVHAAHYDVVAFAAEAEDQ